MKGCFYFAGTAIEVATLELTDEFETYPTTAAGGDAILVAIVVADDVDYDSGSLF